MFSSFSPNLQHISRKKWMIAFNGSCSLIFLLCLQDKSPSRPHILCHVSTGAFNFLWAVRLSATSVLNKFVRYFHPRKWVSGGVQEHGNLQLIDTPQWNFHWHLSYKNQKPLAVFPLQSWLAGFFWNLRLPTRCMEGASTKWRKGLLLMFQSNLCSSNCFLGGVKKT